VRENDARSFTVTDAARLAAKIAFLVSSMLAAGLSLTPRAILAPLRNLGLVLVALALNFVAAPFFALVLSIVIPLERPHAIGLICLVARRARLSCQSSLKGRTATSGSLSRS
jgi:predicted Na+-dependent transporter